MIRVFVFVSELVATAALYEIDSPWEASRGEVLCVFICHSGGYL